MKVKHIVYLVIALFLSAISSADAQGIKVSQELRLVKDTYFKVLGKWGDDYKMARIGTGFVELITFKEDMSIRWGRVIDLVPNEPVVHEVFEGDQEFFILYSINQEDSTRLVLSRYNQQGTVSSVMVVKTMAGEIGRPLYEPMLSKNNKWLSLSYMGMDGLYEVIVISLERMIKVREDVYDLSSFEMNGEYPYHYVANSGKVFVFVETFELVQNRPVQFMTILQIFLDERPTLIKEVDFETHIVETPYFIYDDDSDILYILGVYRDFRVGAGQGIYKKTVYSDFDKDTKSSTFPLAQSVMDDYNKKNKNPLPGIPGLRLVEAFLEKDKSLTLFSEVRFDIERASSMGTLRGTPDMDHYYDEIYIMSVAEDGSPRYQKLLEKEQYSFGDGAVRSSYFIMDREGDYRLIFNESVKRGANIEEYILTPDGTTRRNVVHEERRHTLQPYFSKALKVSESEIVVPSKRNRKANLLRISFSD